MCIRDRSWLLQYTPIYKSFDSETYERLHYLGITNETACAQEISKCNITHRLAKCFDHPTFVGRTQLGFFEETNFYFHSKWLQYIVEVYLQSGLCLISILTNSLIIIALRHRSNLALKKNLANSMYKHIQFNSVFNIVYAVIKLVSLINMCVYPRTSFCSKIYKSPSSQYFKIYMVYFLGNSVRLCANCSYVCFTISRFYLSTSNPSRLSKIYHKLNLTIFYSIVLTISLILNAFKVFQYRVNVYSPGMYIDYPLDGYGVSFCQIMDNLTSLILKPLKKNCMLFNSFNMINTVLNNIVFFCISISVSYTHLTLPTILRV